MMVEPGEPADENDPGSDGDMEHDSDEAEIDALAREVGIVSSVDAGVIPEADGLDVAAHDVWDIVEQHDETKTAAAQAKRSMASGGGHLLQHPPLDSKFSLSALAFESSSG